MWAKVFPPNRTMCYVRSLSMPYRCVTHNVYFVIVLRLSLCAQWEWVLLALCLQRSVYFICTYIQRRVHVRVIDDASIVDSQMQLVVTSDDVKEYIHMLCFDGIIITTVCYTYCIFLSFPNHCSTFFPLLTLRAHLHKNNTNDRLCIAGCHVIHFPALHIS